MSGTSAAALRALADHHLELDTVDGTYRGRLASNTFGDAAVTVLFAVDGADADVPLVIAVDDIRDVRRLA